VYNIASLQSFKVIEGFKDKLEALKHDKDKDLSIVLIGAQGRSTFLIYIIDMVKLIRKAKDKSQPIKEKLWQSLGGARFKKFLQKLAKKLTLCFKK
jgi:hypothetical protein